MSHIIIILDGEPVAVEHEGNEGGKSAQPVSLVTPITDWNSFDHPPSMVQIHESDPDKMNKIVKTIQKFCKK